MNLNHIAKIYDSDIRASTQKMCDYVMFQNMGLEVSSDLQTPHNHLKIGNILISYFSYEKSEELQGCTFSCVICYENVDRDWYNEIVEPAVIRFPKFHKLEWKEDWIFKMTVTISFLKKLGAYENRRY